MNPTFLAGACALAAAFLVCEAQPAHGQDAPAESMPDDHPSTHHQAVPASQAEMDMGDMPGMSMSGMYGPYSMAREASGTSWQPDQTPHEGMHFMGDEWMGMVHGYATAVYDRQGGPRGGLKQFSESMLMADAQRDLGPGTWGLRSMLSLDPFMGKDGYPLLFGSGETANGVTPLVDRQHPHNLFMELGTSYSLRLDERASIFGYLADPVEPALGPPVYMHRFSGMDNPEAPISHHWFDSTHVSFGVATLGYVWNNVKFEASAFHGREPDEFRYRIETGALNSASGRITWNPTEELSLQVSRGHLAGPEQLEPGLSEQRTTATLMYQATLLPSVRWGSTLGWGQDDLSDGVSTSALLLESAARFDGYTLFGRAEKLGNDEYFQAPSPLVGETFRVSKLSLGAVDDFLHIDHIALGAGGLVSRYAHPALLDPAYGHPTSFMVFVRVKTDG